MWLIAMNVLISVINAPLPKLVTLKKVTVSLKFKEFGLAVYLFGFYNPEILTISKLLETSRDLANH